MSFGKPKGLDPLVTSEPKGFPPIWYAGKTTIQGGLDLVLKPEMFQELERMLERLCSELAVQRHDALMPEVGERFDNNSLFRELVLSSAGKALPGAGNPETMRSYIRNIDSYEKFRSLMLSLDDPDPKELAELQKLFRETPIQMKNGLKRADKSIRPHGGKKKTLSNPDLIRALVDEYHNRVKKGNASDVVRNDLANKAGVSRLVFDRRFRDEMKRRRALPSDERGSSDIAE